MYPKLKELRRKNRITVQEMAELLGLQTRGAYYKKESGVHKFSIEEARLIANKLNMPIEEIFLTMRSQKWKLVAALWAVRVKTRHHSKKEGSLMQSHMSLVTQEQFGAVQCDFYQRGEQVWMTREQIGVALDYETPRKAIAKIHERHQDRLDNFSVVDKVTTTDGKAYETYLYSAKGVYEICRWSRQPKADAFMDWVWDVVEKLRTKQAQLVDNSQAQELAAKILLRAVETMMSAKFEEVDRRLAVLEQSSVQSHPGAPEERALETNELDLATLELRHVFNVAKACKQSFYPHSVRPGWEYVGRWDTGRWKYIGFLPHWIRELISSGGNDPDEILRAWRDRGWLKIDKDRQKRLTRTVRVGKLGHKKMVVVKRSAIEKALKATQQGG
ncbi:MAG: helix-turn-helix domain-containing protein [Firmicutes bacterium]|nr:helix-turn-helix domain-containing protein [Bacillota bacterium]